MSLVRKQEGEKDHANYTQQLIDLHDQYLNLVQVPFENNQLFQNDPSLQETEQTRKEPYGAQSLHSGSNLQKESTVLDTAHAPDECQSMKIHLETPDKGQNFTFQHA